MKKKPSPKVKTVARAKARKKIHLMRAGVALAKYPHPPWVKHKNPLPEWILEFDIDNHGVIRSPGKFQGEALWTAYFWDIYLNGGQDDENDKGELIFNVQDADVVEFPELKGKRRVYVYERDDGFVYGRAV